MPVCSAEATWQGTLREGKGHLKLGSGVWQGPYTYRMRFEDEPGTNPEELIAAAHAGCYTMFLSGLLANNRTPAERLECTARVPGLDEAKFQELTQQAKAGCPISKALAAVPEIILDARLI